MIQQKYRESFIQGVKNTLNEDHSKEELVLLLSTLIDEAEDRVIERIADIADDIFYGREYKEFI